MPTAMLPRSPDLPAPDARLVMPECGFEIVAGEVVAVSPAHEPHGSQHSKLSALLEAYGAAGYNAASDMLTRTSLRDDFAPDGSIYPIARDPITGGRQLEELAFEVVVTESLAHAGEKAARLIGRGVRRVFAIDVERGRGLEWSTALDSWEILGTDAAIEDRALVAPLAIRDLVSAGSADDAVARALLAKRNAVVEAALEARHAKGLAEGHAEGLVEGHAEGLAEGHAEGLAEGHAEGLAEGHAEGRVEARRDAIIELLLARGLTPAAPERERILATTDEALLRRWLVAATTCTSTADLLASTP